MFGIAIQLLKAIEKLGYEAYIVGGAVRDILMRKDPSDIDISTNCPMDILRSKFNAHDITGNTTNFGIPGFGVMIVKFWGHMFEIAQFRLDSKYTDGRRPDSVEFTASFAEDVQRRDFTINAIGMDYKGNFIDYVGGIHDIEHRLVRAVGDPNLRFLEDNLRMMRAARFASIEGFRIEKMTRRAIRKHFRLINNVATERIRGEIVKAASKTGKEFANFILTLDDLKLLYQILPEVAALKYFDHDMQHHPEGKSVFKHVVACLNCMTDEGYISKVATLLHDIGKGISFQEDKNWKLTYKGHAEASKKMVEEIGKRLKFSDWETEAIGFASGNHMKFHEILKMRPSKIARLVSNKYFNTLMDVAKADEFSRGEVFKYHNEFRKEVERAFEIKERWENRVVNRSLNIVSGNLIMQVTKLKPGPDVGRIKKLVENKIIDDSIDPDDIVTVARIIIDIYKETNQN